MAKNSTIEELKFDTKNFNKHTEFGMSLLEKSLRQNGAGRSILVDKDNNIIAGNGIVEAAQNAGITKTKVIEVQGDELVVVKRTDLALDSKQGREMALADNATAAADLSWDYEQLEQAAKDFNLETGDWGVNVAGQFDLPEELDGLDLTPDKLTSIEGNDETERERIIIVYKKEQSDQLQRLLNMDKIEKVVYSLDEILGQ